MKSLDDVTAVRLSILTHTIPGYKPREMVDFSPIETICFVPGFRSNDGLSVLADESES